MESHILNSYHQARYRSIGHKIMRTKSDSLSSEGSNQNSPEYAQIALQRAPSIAQSEDSIGEDWCQNQNINTTQSSQDTSSDDESSDGHDAEENVDKVELSDDDDNDDNFVVQEINVDSDENIDVDDSTIPARQNGFQNEDTLVEGHDYDVITVYEVNPDLDLIEASSDDESQADFTIADKEDVIEYLNPDNNIKLSYEHQQARHDNIDVMDAPVVSNVDEYFIKEKDILADDGPVVKDVDEYFIKDKGKKAKQEVTVPNIDDFFIKNKLPEEESTKFHIPETLPNVDEFLVIEKNIQKEPKDKEIISTSKHQEKISGVKGVIEDDILVETIQEPKPQEKLDASINESDLEILPNIEDLKRYLLEEMSYNKLKSIQRSCSLPHSPLHGASVYMDVDDAKTCLSFEDLNLDLSDLAFDSDKDKSDANKSDDIPRTLTDEDVNSFLITNKPETKKETVDDLNPQEMEIEDTLEPIIVAPVETLQESSPTPLPSVIPTKVLEFCVEKTPPSKDTYKNKVAVLDSHATPKKVVIDPSRQVKVVPQDPQFNSPKVKSTGSVVSNHIPVIPMIKKPVAIRPVAPKTIVAKQIVMESNVVPADLDDFVDVESCNDAVIPVLEANNLNSLLEQFEATEKLNKSKKPSRVLPPEEHKKVRSLTNGMRLQDAGVQLKNNKMRQILMPTTINATVRRSPSPVYSDHDYCSSKKRHSLPNIKGGQSLLKPEVLSSNSRILNSRHRSCKNKKVVYNLSSDDEDKDAKNKKLISDSELKKKTIVKPPVKSPAQSNCRKKLSPVHSVDVVLKSNNSVINKCASKASDTPCSQNSNGSIKLTIKNKSEVILNCDLKDSQIKHNDSVEKCRVSSSVSDNLSVNEIKQEKHINIEKYIKHEKHVNGDEKYVSQAEKHTDVKNSKNKERYASNEEKHKHVEKHVKHEEKYIKDNEKHAKGVEKNIKEVVRIKNKNGKFLETELLSVKEETRPKEETNDEHFYTALFSNKHDVKIPQVVPIKKEISAFEEELNKANEIKKEEPHKRKKLNLQEYKLRKGVSSNSSSTAVSPESIFPDMPLPTSDKTAKPLILTLPNDNIMDNKIPKQLYDPIREASRKIVANAKKQKAEALRKRDEDIVMSKIPKVDNLQLQPLISDAEMLKIVGMAQPEPTPEPVIEKPQLPADYDEIIMVSIGTNTDEDIFKKLIHAEIKMIEKFKKKNEKSISPPNDPKSRINFKINKSENVLKQNVFDSKKDKRHEDKQAAKIDKARYKDITATLKSVGKQVDTKICSNSLFASIQDVVMKKAPEEKDGERTQNPKSPIEKRDVFKFGRPTIVREYDAKADHGEDKVILHLGKQRGKPVSTNITIQTDPVSIEDKANTIAKEKSSVNRRRTDSDMSMSSDASPVRVRDKSNKVVKKDKPEKRSLSKDKRSPSKDKRSRSKDRYTTATIKYRRRSRSISRSRRRRSPTRSRSRGRFRRYRRSERSDSPYKRRRWSRSRSYHKRRSASRPTRSQSRRRQTPSVRKPNRSRSRSIPRSQSPAAKKARLSPQIADNVKSMTPPLRKPTVSESSDSSTSSSSSSSSDSSSSSSSSSSSASSAKTGSCTPYKEPPAQKFRSFSSEDRENNTPVEERRIVFVGKLTKDTTKATLRGQFCKFGHVVEVRLHTKEDGSRYGFVTYERARDAWSAVEAAAAFPQYDVGFGGRRAFCRQSYADLDGIEAKYTEFAFQGAAAPPARGEDMSFEQMLLDMKKKLSQRKNDAKHDDP